MNTQKTPIVLAFSGGLDTSYCVLVLKEQGYEVHTVFVDTGGLRADEVNWIEERAMSLGAHQHHRVDASQMIWDEFVVPLIWSQSRMLGEYPMLCSDRYLIVRLSLQLCDELGTRHFAHGCTGMGNDQMRFDQTVRSVGDYEIHAPIRDLQKESGNLRDIEIEYLEKAGHSIPQKTGKYSINENLLGVTISGSEIDQFESPGPETWQTSRPREEWPAQPLRVDIRFEKGEAVAIDGEQMAGPEILQQLNKLFGAYGVGRHIYTGDVTIGLKGRIVFECPGIDALLVAHQALEDCVNTRFQNQFRHLVAQRWAELVYAGFFYEPHKQDLEAYLASSQTYVTGTVTLESTGGSMHAVAVDSDFIIQDPNAIYAQSCTWSPAEAEGFIKLTGQSSTMAQRIREKAK
ncbi:MAG: argininosuccinate synthase [Xanthomonadales bacterium]|nr:argininosuccinate synthase [Xanthomonadales bacterium]